MSYAVIPPSMDINEAGVKKLHDKEVYLFNAVENTLDLTLRFNENRIVTARNLPNGNKRMIYDPVLDVYYEDGPTVVTNDDGNVIVAKG
jgi:hypothetical protein